MPTTYIWSWHHSGVQYEDRGFNKIVMESNVIVGQLRTAEPPLLTSNVVNFITYPQWTVPYSIIFKEMLPKIKRQPLRYLNKQNLMVVDNNDNVLNPDSLNWGKYNKITSLPDKAATGR